MDQGVRRNRRLYAQVVRRMLENNMIEVSDEEGEETIGFFCVRKSGDRQRLVLDARRSNCHFGDPPSTPLPTGALFAQMDLSGEDDAFYHIALDTEYRKYFHLPPLPVEVARRVGLRFDSRVVKHGLLHLRMCVTPMGWKWALHVAQQAFTGLVCRALSVENTLTDAEVMKPVSEGIPAMNACKRVNWLPTHGLVDPCREADVLGWSIDLDKGVVRPKGSRGQRLWLAITHLLAKPFASPKHLEQITGHMVFMSLIRRPVMLVLQSVHQFIHGCPKKDRLQWIPLQVQ
eukprot:2959324-Amphidinium_carterae.1